MKQTHPPDQGGGDSSGGKTQTGRTAYDFVVIIMELLGLTKARRFWKFLVVGILLINGLGIVAWFVPSYRCTGLKLLDISDALAQCAASPVARKPLRVAYFYVDPNGAGSAAQDGAVQKEGFEAGVAEFSESSIPPHVESHAFSYVAGVKNAHEAVLNTMKRLYDGNSVRIFVVTMSQIVTPLRGTFKEWRNTIADPRERPVLVVTVASASDLADGDSGIVRLYVRSIEEASELAKYAMWRLHAKRAGVFHIDDAYGDGGAQLLDEELRRGDCPSLKAYSVGGDAESKEIRPKVQNWVRDVGEKSAAAFVVGYGDMLKRTISVLRQEGYRGAILSTSTITHVKWRPTPETMPDSILTAVPRRIKGIIGRSRDDDVVRFFSRTTVRKALECAELTNDTTDFVKAWVSGEKCNRAVRDGGLMVDYLANGDAIVSLEVKNPWH